VERDRSIGIGQVNGVHRMGSRLVHRACWMPSPLSLLSSRPQRRDLAPPGAIGLDAHRQRSGLPLTSEPRSLTECSAPPPMLRVDTGPGVPRQNRAWRREISPLRSR
jgi:hypothetical protein